MGWAKFDDRYDDHPKVKRAYRGHARAVSVHSMAITYCARHEFDGLVDPGWIEEKLPARKEREICLAVLVDTGLFETADDGHYIVHDYLDYNPSRAQLEEKRRKDSARKAQGGSNGKPGGIRNDSERIPRGIQTDSKSPVPSRPVPVVPDPTTPTADGGGGTRRTSSSSDGFVEPNGRAAA